MRKFFDQAMSILTLAAKEERGARSKEKTEITIESDRNERPFIYFAVEQIPDSNPLYTKFRTKEGKIDLRKIRPSEFSEYVIQGDGPMKGGFYGRNIYGFTMTAKENKEGGKVHKIYTVKDINNNIVGANIENYGAARTLMLDATDKYKAELEEKFNNLNKNSQIEGGARDSEEDIKEVGGADTSSHEKQWQTPESVVEHLKKYAIPEYFRAIGIDPITEEGVEHALEGTFREITDAASPQQAIDAFYRLAGYDINIHSEEYQTIKRLLEAELGDIKKPQVEPELKEEETPEGRTKEQLEKLEKLAMGEFGQTYKEAYMHDWIKNTVDPKLNVSQEKIEAVFYLLWGLIKYHEMEELLEKIPELKDTTL
jgi:hypothetical protein